MTDLEQWVKESTAAQGLNVKVRDLDTIADLVALLRGARVRHANRQQSSWRRIATDATSSSRDCPA